MHAPFELYGPRSLSEALDVLADGAHLRSMPIAGGTNLIVDMRAGRERPDRVISLGEIEELRGMEFGSEWISIGGCTSVSEILHSAAMAEAAPSLVESARLFAGLMVRNTATVAGNIACGSPAADLVPPLLSLDARITLASSGGMSTVDLDSFFLGYKRDRRKPNELITGIVWPRLRENSCNSFYKLARRKGDAITVTGIAVTISETDGVCTRAPHRAGSRRTRRASCERGGIVAGGSRTVSGQDRGGRRGGGSGLQSH